ELRLTQKLGLYLDKQNNLLLDEIVDTGKSFQRAIAYLNHLRSNSITSVSLHVKHHAIIKPDYFSAETTKWVVYPYEIQETIDSLKPIWLKAKLPTEDLQQKLIKGGFPKLFVDKYL